MYDTIPLRFTIPFLFFYVTSEQGGCGRMT